jgi:hypothetical protein
MLRRALTTRRTRLTAGAALLLAVAATPVALGAGEGEPIQGGVRNPDRGGDLRGETEIIANNGSYGTRQSNKGSGGGAIYGCRSDRDDEPCVRANNLRRGKAFEFETGGNLGSAATRRSRSPPTGAAGSRTCTPTGSTRPTSRRSGSA